MTRDDAKKIINGMMIAYPNYHPADLSGTVNLWASMFADKDYKIVSAGLQAYIASDTTGFAPSPGQVIALITKTTHDDPLDAWAKVVKAIRNSAYNSEEEFAKLPEAVQKAVGSPVNLEAWGQLPSDTVHSVTQSQFLKAYTAILEREKTDERIPQNVRELISASMPKIGGEHGERSALRGGAPDDRGSVRGRKLLQVSGTDDVLKDIQGRTVAVEKDGGLQGVL